MLPNRVPHRLPTIRLALATRRHRLLGEAFYSLPHGHSLAPKRQSRAYFAVGGIANRTRERVGATPQIREAHGRCLVSTRNIAVAWCTNALDGWWGHVRFRANSRRSRPSQKFPLSGRSRQHDEAVVMEDAQRRSPRAKGSAGARGKVGRSSSDRRTNDEQVFGGGR